MSALRLRYVGDSEQIPPGCRPFKIDFYQLDFDKTVVMLQPDDSNASGQELSLLHPDMFWLGSQFLSRFHVLTRRIPGVLRSKLWKEANV